MYRLLILSLVPFAAAVPPKNCTAPPNVIPVVSEGLCYTEIIPSNPSGVSIRRYGVGTPNSTLAIGVGDGVYPGGAENAIASVIGYFSGANDDNENILSARTVPFLVVPPSTGTRRRTGGEGEGSYYWTAALEVSPTQYPDNFLIPRPIQNSPVTLSKVNDNLGLFAVFQFNTTGFPYIENIEEACGVIQNSTLPKGYAINTTNFWTPTYVFYNGERTAEFTNECWMAVYPVSQV